MPADSIALRNSFCLLCEVNCRCQGSYRSTAGRAFSGSAALSGIRVVSVMGRLSFVNGRRRLPLARAAPTPPTLLSMGLLAEIRGQANFSPPARPCPAAARVQPSRNAMTPARMLSAAALRHAVIFSPSANTEIAMANRIEVSRRDATEAIGAWVIAHMTMP